jgi:SH3-like domain-containing protein
MTSSLAVQRGPWHQGRMSGTPTYRSARATTLVLAMVFLPAHAVAASARSRPQPSILSVAVDEANFRSGPSQQHDIVFTAIRYFPVKVVERVKGWIKVEDFEGDQGWVADHLLSEEPTVIVSAEHANLRKEPNVKSEAIGTADHAQVYKVIERRERWLKLSSEDEERGWIRDDLVWGD